VRGGSTKEASDQPPKRPTSPKISASIGTGQGLSIGDGLKFGIGFGLVMAVAVPIILGVSGCLLWIVAASPFKPCYTSWAAD
jgi:hypothetical protein